MAWWRKIRRPVRIGIGDIVVVENTRFTVTGFRHQFGTEESVVQIRAVRRDRDPFG